MYRNNSFFPFLLLAGIILASGCYSLSGVSIDPSVKTYFVYEFKNNALNSPSSLALTVTENLKDKIRTESRLAYTELNPDIEFKGTIVDYRVTSEAPQPGEISSINRLTILTSIEYIHNKDEEKGWKSNFSHFFDFPSSQDLSSIEEQAISEIFDQILEDIFNRAFTDW